MKRSLQLGAACAAVIGFLAAYPPGAAHFDLFDLAAALLACSVAIATCARAKSWPFFASVAYVLSLILIGLETGNRVSGYPDKEWLWAADLLWIPLLAALVFRRSFRVLLLVGATIGCAWLGFGARQLAYLRHELNQPSTRLEIKAVSKVTAGRLWAFGCLDGLPVVAVYTLPASLNDVRQLLDGQGSMDAQVPNVPLPFRWKVACHARADRAQ